MFAFLRSRFSRRSNDATPPTVIVDDRRLTAMQTIVLYVAANALRERLEDPAYFGDRSHLGPVYRAEAEALCELLKPRAAAAPRSPAPLVENPT